MSEDLNELREQRTATGHGQMRDQGRKQGRCKKREKEGWVLRAAPPSGGQGSYTASGKSRPIPAPATRWPSPSCSPPSGLAIPARVTPREGQEAGGKRPPGAANGDAQRSGAAAARVKRWARGRRAVGGGEARGAGARGGSRRHRWVARSPVPSG